MTKTIEISITQEDIDKGRPIHVRLCPIALAAQRALDNPRVTVGVDDMGYWLARYHLPLEAQQFIIAFDMGRKVQPFKFYATKA